MSGCRGRGINWWCAGIRSLSRRLVEQIWRGGWGLSVRSERTIEPSIKGNEGHVANASCKITYSESQKMIDDLGIDEWYLESNPRGHWLAFNASQIGAEMLVEALDATSLGARAWGESFRPAADGISYDWYVLIASKCRRDECLRVLEGILGSDGVSPELLSGAHPHPGKSFWQRVVSLLPWVHDDPTSDIVAETPPARSVFDDLNDVRRRPVHELHVSFETGTWPASGVLSELGYKVGRSGLGPAERHRILRTALTVTLVATSREANDYIQDWGRPNSRQRAAKIERCLVKFADNARRRSADMSEAIADWEDDLVWFRGELNY